MTEATAGALEYNNCDCKNLVYNDLVDICKNDDIILSILLNHNLEI